MEFDNVRHPPSKTNVLSWTRQNSSIYTTSKHKSLKHKYKAKSQFQTQKATVITTNKLKRQ